MFFFKLKIDCLEKYCKVFLHFWKTTFPIFAAVAATLVAKTRNWSNANAREGFIWDAWTKGQPASTTTTTLFVIFVLNIIKQHNVFVFITTFSILLNCLNNMYMWSIHLLILLWQNYLFSFVYFIIYRCILFSGIKWFL